MIFRERCESTRGLGNNDHVAPTNIDWPIEIMFPLTRDKTLYSLRVYLSAIVALGIAFWKDFDYPYWAMTLVYVLIQPTTGLTRLKASHMVAGAMAGAVAGVVSAAVFATSPLAQLIAITLFVMATSVGALRDRRPRYYAYMLSGITCLLVAMPGIATPDMAFDRAVGRLQDTLLAVGVFLVIDALVFPGEQRSVTMALAAAWLSDLRQEATGTLRGIPVDQRARGGVVQRAVQLVPSVDGASRDDAPLARRRETLIGIVDRGMRLLPVLSAFVDLDRATPMRTWHPDDLALREALAQWIEAGCPDNANASALRRRLRSREQGLDQRSMDSVTRRCHTRYLRAIHACLRRAQRDYERGPARPSPAAPHRRPMPATIGQVDANFATRGVLSIGLYALLMGGLWCATGWVEATMALSMLMGMAFCLTAGMADDPVAALRNPSKVAGVAMLAVGFYIQVVFPSVDAFPVLAIALFPALFLLGLVVQQPGGVLFAILPMALLRIGNGQAGITIDSLANSVIGLYIGIGVAVVVKMLIQRPALPDIARRLMRHNRRQLRKIVDRPGVDLRPFSMDALDRYALLETRFPRFESDVPRSVQPGLQMLRELRIGRSMHALQRAARQPWVQHTVIEPVGRNLSTAMQTRGDPFVPWVTESLTGFVESTLRTLLAGERVNAAVVRSLFEIRVALEAIRIPHDNAAPAKP
ncbi:FUSC family protein [Burkholderia cenocepacia]|uniref:FUSC family protein n=1 Tax=Burkholderia cenocepacia TaxID=95486 RepID=A0ABD4UJ11_9BURK|nr:FUSC family protein [Burkholderia cenocepacia]MCW3698181.1 FUSC family protein [Burkholderia cenocepacia]MCW3706034.1 FUSC family protein [Burkholderia cenocepacia]MCW3714275.1 FUSC family protein [Burkholderia cenocepacia]MCW3722341.1 FUSC family protein [Burkholderia cenocepacia]MCW3730521.1 FUSC family protein [Burkholderia cenocepacia]